MFLDVCKTLLAIETIRGAGKITEWARVHEPPKSVLPKFQPLMGVTWTRNDLFENYTKDVGYDLQKELADEDGLRPEVLRVDSQFNTCIR
jgi:hypothetical protein